MVFFSSRISPLTSTVIFLERSPVATAVVTAAMLRTWLVKLPAMKFTESVRSFHVPAASRGVIRANDAREFVAAFRRIAAILAGVEASLPDEARRTLLVETFVPGREVALEGLLVGGTLHVLALFDKPDPLDGPFFEETIYVTPSRLARTAQQEIAACAQAAVRALGLREGPIHAELRYNENGPWLIELAARPIGGRCSAVLRFGDQKVSLEEIILRHALGMALPSLQRERVAAGVM